MSSAQEPHLLPPPKPKLSPLELRNTDLVSRLLAATPPYLYNMSLLPNTYFFSEMLRSFVQAKNEQNAQRGNIGGGFGNNVNMYYGHTMRRSRKRGWNNVGRENVLQSNAIMEEKVEKTSEKMETNEPWMIKSMRKNEDNALELTTNSDNIHQKIEDHQRQKTPKLEDQPLPFTPQQDNSTNLVLPPPPPIWYPPIYPTPPYGIDPLHFFIDLRVSGHIYDKQNNNQVHKDGSSGSNISTASPSGENGSNTTVVGPKEQETTEIEQKTIKVEDPIGDIFRQKRHCSAFSVPNSSGTFKNRVPDKSQTRFDVKSMGFDKDLNKTSTNYIMSNISNIYKNLLDTRSKMTHPASYSTSRSKAKATDNSMNIDINMEETRHDSNNDQTVTNICNRAATTSNQSEEEKQKKANALRALIGMELVVDYMDHKKGKEERPNGSYVISEGEEEEEFGSEIESVGSPQLEVVAVQDDV